jgi:uncharacterized protein YbbK (DUF523 family)
LHTLNHFGGDPLEEPVRHLRLAALVVFLISLFALKDLSPSCGTS